MNALYERLKKFLTYGSNILRDTYFWNTTSNLLVAFQSVILLIIMTRTVELTDSGIFAIAYANANLFLLIGKYGVRNYQVSDVTGRHSFNEYRFVRIISTAIMCACGLIYSLYMWTSGKYSFYKGTIVALMCLYKVPDAIEDLYYGEYQKKGRLDVASKSMTLRLILTISVMSISLIVTKNLVLSILLSTGISFFCLYLVLKISNEVFDYEIGIENKSLKSIGVACFPLFLGGFLSQYINNAPKYAIDSILTDEIQACYGFIAMPVFVIGLCSNILFSPTIHKMAEYWSKGFRQKFLNNFLLQIGYIIIITIIVIFGAWSIGIQVLSIIYNTDLYDYKLALIVLLLGGGFLALSNIINIMLTIMRKQHELIIGYLSIAIISVIYSEKIVMNYGMMGAVWLYTGLIVLLDMIFIILFVIEYNKK